jgi:hypothetical protein
MPALCTGPAMTLGNMRNAMGADDVRNWNEDTAMNIEAISREEFDRYRASRGSFPWVHERGWFRLAAILGILIFDAVEENWSYVVLLPDADGRYRGGDLGTKFESSEDAIAALHQSMRKLRNG